MCKLKGINKVIIDACLYNDIGEMWLYALNTGATYKLVRTLIETQIRR